MRSIPVIAAAVRAEAAIVAAVGAIVLVTSLLVAAVPPLVTDRYDAAVRDLVDGTEPVRRDVTLTALLVGRQGPQALIRTDPGLRTATGKINSVVPGTLRAVAEPIEYSAALRPAAYGSNGPAAPPDRLQQVMLGWDPGVAGRVRYVSGRAPRNPVPDTGKVPVIEVGLAAKTSAAMRIPAGAELRMTLGSKPAIARVAGLYEPAAASDRFWRTRPGLIAPEVREETPSTPTIYIAAGMLDAAGYQAVYDRTDASIDYTWRLPISPGAFTASRAGPVVADITELGLAAGNLDATQLNLRPQTTSGLDEQLTGFVGQLRAAQTVLYLALAGLFAVAFGVLALACRLLTERLRTPLATMRARGASQAQLSLGVGLTALLVALPTAAAGYGLAAALTPGTAALPGVLAVLAGTVLLPAVLAAWDHRRSGRTERSDLAQRRAGPRQIVFELLAVALAIAGVGALRSRGLTTESAEHGADPFLVMVPVLLAFAVGMLTLRAYPYPLRLVGRLTARRRSAVPFLGVSRAARQGIVAALPVIVLLLATAVAGFAAAVDAGLRRAQDSAAWLATGADARVTGIDLDAAAGARIRQVPGVQGVVPAQYVDSATLGVALSSVNVTLVAVDLTAYRQLVAGTPIEVPRPSPDGSGVPALLSPELAQRVGSGQLNASSGVTPEVTVRPAGTVDVFPGATGDFVIVPYRALGAAAKPNTFFVHGDHLDQDRLRRAAGRNAIVTTQVAAHERLTGTPMIDLVRTAFRYGTLVVVGYATLAVLLALILGSGARGQVVTYLRALGLSRAQARRLAIVELAPVLLCAAVAGWVAGVLLPHLVGPAVDLRPYTGGFRVTDYTPDPLPTIAVAAGLIAFGGIAIIIDTMVGTRRQLGPELRKEAQR